MSWKNALRYVEIPEEDMEGRVCSCPETGNPDEFGDGSSLPCMGWELDNDLRCSMCIYCVKRESINKESHV